MSTPQYQSYGGTTARTDTSPASRLDVFKKPPDPDVLAKVGHFDFYLVTFPRAWILELYKTYLGIDNDEVQYYKKETATFSLKINFLCLVWVWQLVSR